MTYEEVCDYFQEELHLLSVHCRRILKNDIPGFDKNLVAVLSGGGKCIRALVLFIFSREARSVHSGAPFCAACVELLHLASLLQDDVIDEARTRRGRFAAYHILGKKMAVLSGDFLSIRVIQEVEKRSCHDMLRSFISHAGEMIEGEIGQTLCGNRVDLTEEEYFRFVERKTGALFALAAEAGALLSHRRTSPAADFGRHFGVAFQIIDDLMDFTMDAHSSGKEPFTDMRNGLLTLPIIHFIRQGGDLSRFHALAERGAGPEATALLTSTGSLEYTLTRAREQVRLALSAAGECLGYDAVETLADISGELLGRIKEGVLHGV